MLIYHPVHDINHCLYRILALLEMSEHKEIDWEVIKLMDFYVLFPHQLKNIKPFPMELIKHKKIVNSLPDAYEFMPNTKRILFELEGIQNTAIQNLMAKGLINVENFKKQKVSRTNTPLPEKIIASFGKTGFTSKNWFKVIANNLPSIEFSGKSGLKFRSSLLEYKYDS